MLYSNADCFSQQVLTAARLSAMSSTTNMAGGGLIECTPTTNASRFEFQAGPQHDVALPLVFQALGFLSNLLSLVVFVRLYRKPQNRNHVHIFFIYLSVSEVILNYSMMVFFLVSVTLSVCFCVSFVNKVLATSLTCLVQRL